MDPIQKFDDTTTALRTATDAVLDAAEAILPLIAAAKACLGACDFAVATLRRSEDIGQGPLNSVSAVQQSHRALAHGLEEFNQHTLRLFDIRRDVGALHGPVLTALQTPADVAGPEDAT